MYLIDSNIFLEALLKQEKENVVVKFLDNLEEGAISSFSLNSIGIILYRLGKFELYEKFISDILQANIKVLSLDANDMTDLISVVNKLKLDYDDSYQYLIAKKNSLLIVSFDRDFDKTDIERIEP